MNIKDFTFIITTYKSEKLIFNCIKNLPKQTRKIVIENSSNLELKYKLEKRFKNTKCYIMKKNLGYGRANNYGIKKANTQYVFIINPDVILKLNLSPFSNNPAIEKLSFFKILIIFKKFFKFKITSGLIINTY